MIEVGNSLLFNPDLFAEGSPEPQDLGLPFESWRPEQWDVICRCLFSDKRFILIEAPTGVGKSGIAVALAKLAGLPTAILTSTLQLQDQYIKLGCKTVKGRKNFPCILENEQVTCDDAPCTLGIYCPHKEVNKDDGDSDLDGLPACFYYRQKAVALANPVSVHSYSYFLSECNYVGKFSRPDQLLILDEAHLVEEEIRRFIEVSYHGSNLTRLLTGWEDWREYARARHPDVQDQVRELRRSLKGETNPTKLKQLKKLIAEEKSLAQLKHIDKSWVIDRENNKYGATFRFRPAWVAHYAEPLLFRHASKIVMMSATILDPDMFCAMLGLDPDEVEYIPLDSPFNPALRPLSYQPAMRVTSRAEDYTPLITAIDDILDHHAEDKGIIHTTNYKIAKLIMEGSRHRDRLVSHEGASGRATALDDYVASDRPLVLVSPSMGTGVDLPHDLLRFQVIAKLPFPDRGDRQVQRRLEVGPDGADDPNPGGRWYSWATACHLVQMYGRAMRSVDDYGATYLIDGSWGWWYSQNKRLIPQWVRESLTT